MKAFSSAVAFLAFTAGVLADAHAHSHQHISRSAPQIQETVKVLGPNANELVIQFSPEVTSLTASLQLSSLAAPVGFVIKTAETVETLLEGLTTSAENVFCVENTESSYLLIQWSSSVTSLINGLSLPDVNIALGSVITSLDETLDFLSVEALSGVLGEQVNNLLTVAGSDSTRMLIQLNTEFLQPFVHIGLVGLRASVGRVIAEADSISALVFGIGLNVGKFITVEAQNGRCMLIELETSLLDIFAGLEHPSVHVAIGSVLLEVNITI